MADRFDPALFFMDFARYSAYSIFSSTAYARINGQSTQISAQSITPRYHPRLAPQITPQIAPTVPKPSSSIEVLASRLIQKNSHTKQSVFIVFDGLCLRWLGFYSIVIFGSLIASPQPG